MPSEEEGLALLGNDTLPLASQEPDAHPSLLDYDSDGRESDDAASSAYAGNTQVSSKLTTAGPADMETDTNENAPSSSDAFYHQCKSARLYSRKDILISVSPDTSFGKTVTVQSPSIGSFSDRNDIENTFHGSRIMKGSNVANESLSCSFDLSKLNCLSCGTEHSIIGKDPLVVFFSDQNFPGMLSCRHGKCINIVRLENSSLSELFDVAREIFSQVQLPEGSVFLFGSASDLGKSGTSLYARSWTEVLARSSSQWRGVRICPLIPLIMSECSGSIVRELSELTTWFKKVYDSDPQGLRESWVGHVRAMETCSMGTMRSLDHVVTFCSNSTRPVTFKGLSKDLHCELLGTLLSLIFENFRACLRPEEYLVRADVENPESENREQKVLLVGASNLSHSLPYFTDPSLSFVDITQPGWIASPENIKKLREQLETIAIESVGIVFDLLGNSSVRYEQFDSTTTLPFKSNGRFHFGGKVVTTPKDIFKKVVESVIPILKTKGNTPCVIVPPLPRYLFSRCCNDESHCTNVKEENFAKHLLAGFLQLRTDLIRQLVQCGLTNFKVLDSCCTTSCEKTAIIPERIVSLKETTKKDGIHFTEKGSDSLATRAISCLKSLMSAPKKTKKKNTYFWRGFRSPVGSNTLRSSNTALAGRPGSVSRGAFRGRTRGQTAGYHPYKRW
jgi:hypothetical protein